VLAADLSGAPHAEPREQLRRGAATERKRMESPKEMLDILLVEDSPGDARLAIEALTRGEVPRRLVHVEDGVEAMDYLRRRGQYSDAIRPDLILLDLNLPRCDGRQVLAEIKADEELRRIPIVVLTISNEEEDVLRSFDLHANSFITKPIDFEQFLHVVRSIEDFWMHTAPSASREQRRARGERPRG
jgi:chemotaxis family two-component system response regulator Rcp1